MEHGSGAHRGRGKDENGQGNKAVVDNAKNVNKPSGNLTSDVTDPKAQDNAESDEVVGGKGPSGEVNMEASITPDDVLRAGGLGARDDISSFLPVASDTTDFEAAIRDARDYEEPQGEPVRPGLGWGQPRQAQ